jgi:hypothetical protein
VKKGANVVQINPTHLIEKNSMDPIWVEGLKVIILVNLGYMSFSKTFKP